MQDYLEKRVGLLHLLGMWRRRRAHAARRMHSCIIDQRLAGGSRVHTAVAGAQPIRLHEYLQTWAAPVLATNHLGLAATLAGGGREAQAPGAGPVWGLEPAGKLDLQP